MEILYKNRPAHIYSQCQLLYLNMNLNRHAHAHIQIAHAKQCDSNLYQSCIRKTPTEPQQDTFNFHFLQSIAIPIIFPPTRYLMSNEPYQYWKWTAIYHQQTDHADSIALLLLSASARVQSLCSTLIKLWPFLALMTLWWRMTMRNIKWTPLHGPVWNNNSVEAREEFY